MNCLLFSILIAGVVPAPAKGSSTNIQVAMCNDGSSNDDSSNYFVYQLPKPKSCDQRYCGED